MQAQKEATLLCTRQIQQTIAVVYMHMVKTIIEPVAFLQAGKKGILLTETMCIMWGGGGGDITHWYRNKMHLENVETGSAPV